MDKKYFLFKTVGIGYVITFDEFFKTQHGRIHIENDLRNFRDLVHSQPQISSDCEKALMGDRFAYRRLHHHPFNIEKTETYNMYYFGGNFYVAFKAQRPFPNRNDFIPAEQHIQDEYERLREWSCSYSMDNMSLAEISSIVSQNKDSVLSKAREYGYTDTKDEPCFFSDSC
jgi:hypothetical protein